MATLKRPRTPPATPSIVDYQNPDHELMKRLRPAPSVEEVIYFFFHSGKLFVRFLHFSQNILSIIRFQVTYPAPRQQALWSPEDLPLKVALALHQGSTVTSMEFHPMQNTLLLGMVV